MDRWSCRIARMALLTTAMSCIAASEPTAQSIPEGFSIGLERTSCFGQCPVYTVTIDAKGNVIYEGSRFVRVEGRQTDRVPLSRVAALLATTERIGFFDLRDQYRTIRSADGSEAMVTDLPTAYVTVTRGGRSKRIEDYFGAPEGLKQLEQQIDETAGTRRWIRADEPAHEGSR
jgi:hypothetical protein